MEPFKMSIQQVEDYREDIARLLKQSLVSSFTNYIPEYYFEQRVNILKSYLADDKAVIFGITEDIGLVGFIWICEREQFEKKKIHVVHFVVDSEKRGTGLGSKLLNSVEEYAKQINVDVVELLVTKSNEDAVEFYLNKQFNIERYMMIKRLNE